MRINRLIILVILSVISGLVKGQSPTGLPFPNAPTAYYNIGWLRADSGSIPALRDTTLRPLFPGTSIFWQHAGVDSVGWVWDGNRWKRGGGVSTFNGRSGNVLLLGSDVNSALGYTPLANITSYLQSGTNVTVTGLGTLASPYVINSSGGGGGGTVSSFSFSSGNGITGVVTNSTTTPNLSLGTSLTGIINGNGTGFGTVGIGPGLSYVGGTLSATGGTSLNGLVSANGSAFTTASIGAGLSFTSNTLTNTINNTNQLTNGAGFLTNITSLISAGTNVTITGSGTSGSPYVINSSGGGGGGTLTNFSAGTLSPLFTTSVSNPTTIPGLSFTLSNATANSVFGNNTGSSAPPVYYVPTITTLNGWASGTIALLGSSQTFTGNNIFNGTSTYGAAVAFSTTNSISIGGSSDVAAHVWSRSFNSDVAAVLSSTTGNSASLAIGANNGITLLSSGQAQLNNYTTPTSFTGTLTSLLGVDASGNIIQTPAITNIFAVEGTSPAGSDSIQFGGSLGAFYKPDTLYTQYQGLYIYNLNDKSTLGAGDSVLILDAAKQMRLVPSSAIGGSGAVSSVADNGTGTTVISPTTGSVLVGVNASAFPVSFVPAVNNSVNIGSSSKNWENLYVNNIISPGALAFEVPTGSAYQFNINGTTNMGLLTTGQLQLQNYTTTSSFTGTAVGVLEFTSSGAIITAGLPSGAVSSVSDNGGGTLTISPTTGAVLAGINLANSNTWTATNNSFKNILPSATTTYSLGSTGAYWNNVYTNNLDVNNILPPSNLLIQLATGQSMQTAINGVTKEELLSTGQKQLNGYGSGTFTGTPTFALNVDATGHLIEGTVGGGSTLTRQTITSGTSATGTNVTTTLSVFFNFSTTASTFTFTMPPSPIDGQVVKIGCGGSIVYPNSEITTLTIAPNSGQNIIATSSTLNTLASGESAEYEYISSLTGWLRER